MTSKATLQADYQRGLGEEIAAVAIEFIILLGRDRAAAENVLRRALDVLTDPDVNYGTANRKSA